MIPSEKTEERKTEKRGSRCEAAEICQIFFWHHYRHYLASNGKRSSWDFTTGPIRQPFPSHKASNGIIIHSYSTLFLHAVPGRADKKTKNNRNQIRAFTVIWTLCIQTKVCKAGKVKDLVSENQKNMFSAPVVIEQKSPSKSFFV